MHSIHCDADGCDNRVDDSDPKVIDEAAAFHGWIWSEDQSGDHADFCPDHHADAWPGTKGP